MSAPPYPCGPLLVVIGSGGAAMAAALKAVERGWHVTLTHQRAGHLRRR